MVLGIWAGLLLWEAGTERTVFPHHVQTFRDRLACHSFTSPTAVGTGEHTETAGD